ncbi:hypothetical protein TNCV_4307361 [Trichonephila clavipes]|nr:hypothetical protein TNCV_4307361 [Trichonephila clavipes]
MGDVGKADMLRALYDKYENSKKWWNSQFFVLLEMAYVNSYVAYKELRETYLLWSDFHAEIVEVEIEVVSPSIVPSGNFVELNRTVTCMVLKANDRRTSCPCHDEFRGPRSDYVRQVALENIKQQQTPRFTF